MFLPAPTTLDRLFAASLTFIIVVMCLYAFAAHAGGNYADSKMHDWFNGLASHKGLCCSFADGRTLADPDWGTKDDHYWVIVDNVRYAVPEAAVVVEPNKFGTAVVWPYTDWQGQVQIRCFMPGGGT